MAVSRPLLLALLGLVLAAATLFAARGASQSAADTASSAVVLPPAATPVSPGPGNKAKDPVGTGTKDRQRDGSSRREPTGDANPGRGPDKPARPAPKPEATLPSGVPVDVGRALRDRQVVVLFFGQGGADDVATAEAVASLRGLKRVAVFRDGIQNLGKYARIVSGLGVAQAPAVVIVGTRRRARLIEGFVDSGTLRQQVVDAR